MELVLQGGQPDGAHGGQHQQTPAAGRGGRTTQSAGQTALYPTPLHGKANLLKSLIANIRAALQHVKQAAEQFKSADRWAVLLRYVSHRIAPVIGPFRPPNGLPTTG